MSSSIVITALLLFQAKIIPAAEGWLANQMGMPANTKQVFTEDEFLLFMDLFNQLSQSGTKVVKYPELCTNWNREVVTRMRNLDATEDPAVVFEHVRFKTKNELKEYATKVVAHHTVAHV